MSDEKKPVQDTAGSRGKIIAVGGGKGGVGKSVIAANLAVSLALMDKRVILIDMDFGSANLHTCIGEKSPASSIKDFILKKANTLSGIVIDTEIENLKFISGAGDMPGLANMGYLQKIKIIRHIKALDADYIVMDLAPGITFNVLDFFSIADKPVLITTTEMTSITNTFSFMKAYLFRVLSKVFKSESEVMALLKLATDPRNDRGIRTFADLENSIGRIDIEESRKFKSAIESFKPKFILNMVRHKDQAMGHALISLVEQCLSVKCKCLGCVNYDELVPESVLKMKPFVLEYPESELTASFWDITSRVIDMFPDYELPVVAEKEMPQETGKPIEVTKEPVEANAELEEIANEPVKAVKEPDKELVEVAAMAAKEPDKEPAKPETLASRWGTHVSSERPHTREKDEETEDEGEYDE